MSPQLDLSVTFYARPPGIWQLLFWGAWAALSLLLAIGWWSEPFATGRFAIALGMAACFAAFLVTTLRHRQRDAKPAVVVSRNGLLFRPETSFERIVRWDQLKQIMDDRRGSIVFDTIDNKRLGGRALMFFPAGIYVSAKCRTKSGERLALVIGDLWRELAAGSGR